MYSDWKGNISRCLNNGLHDTLLPDLVMICIIPFCILKIFIAWVEFPQKMMPYDIKECTYAKLIIFRSSTGNSGVMTLNELAELSLCNSWLTWSYHDSFSSMIVPRNFVLESLVIYFLVLGSQSPVFYYFWF
jgi:hypothetical protein